ncbi:hypothetical protein K438DRAFT_1265226 [Mycena galopus ATCC 62051]|nr:hypothetical protein K438DRAFT_1265226 [Mycena galopus ATCC 62051]
MRRHRHTSWSPTIYQLRIIHPHTRVPNTMAVRHLFSYPTHTPRDTAPHLYMVHRIIHCIHLVVVLLGLVESNRKFLESKMNSRRAKCLYRTACN